MCIRWGLPKKQNSSFLCACTLSRINIFTYFFSVFHFYHFCSLQFKIARVFVSSRVCEKREEKWGNNRWSTASLREERWFSLSILSSLEILPVLHRSAFRNSLLPTTSSPITVMDILLTTSSMTASVSFFFFFIFSLFLLCVCSDL